jgi:hypothetical protein
VNGRHEVGLGIVEVASDRRDLHSRRQVQRGVKDPEVSDRHRPIAAPDVLPGTDGRRGRESLRGDEMVLTSQPEGAGRQRGLALLLGGALGGSLCGERGGECDRERHGEDQGPVRHASSWGCRASRGVPRSPRRGHPRA